MRLFREIRLAAIVAIVLPLLAAGLVYWQTGLSLGLLLALPVILAILLPPLLTAHPRRFPRLLLAGLCIDTLGLFLLVIVPLSPLTLWQWLQTYLLLAAFALALLGLHHLLLLARLPSILASMLVTTLAALWLTWPIWLSHHLTPAQVDTLVSPHPLFAINSIHQSLFGIWTEYGVIYSLSTLNQDVPYSLPDSPWPAILLHALLCIPLLVPISPIAGQRNQSSTPPDATASTRRKSSS